MQYQFLRRLGRAALFSALAAALLLFAACAPPQASGPAPTSAAIATAVIATSDQPAQTTAVAAESQPAAELPRVFLLDPQALATIRAQVASGDQTLDPALAQLTKDAGKAMRAGPFSVVSKSITPPSGDKHDFVSLARYWWPNPDTADGRPYVRRDGKSNPEIDKYPDPKNFDSMVSAVKTLSLAFYLTGEQRYATRATTLLRAWFLDQDTRMNPNLNYGQFVPGVDDDHGSSVLDTRNLTEVIDSIGLLDSSSAWTNADQQGMQQWFGQYEDWLLNSDIAQQDAKSANNHATWYDTQVTAIALFLGRDDLAQRVLRESLPKRIAQQIEPDGRQPLELERTRSWFYSIFNLTALFQLATLGDRAGVSVWTYQTADGRSIHKALDWLTPYALGKQKWPYKQIGDWDASPLVPLLRQAAMVYHDDHYQQLSDSIAGSDAASDRINLMLAQPIGQ